MTELPESTYIVVEHFEYPDRIPKAEWGEGPWHDEPDKIVWIDPTTDLDCMIVRGPLGALCGYVGVPRDHPLYGKDATEVEADVEVHGGLNYSNPCVGHICHVPQEGRPKDVWWLGFDCAHSQDRIPHMEAPGNPFRYPAYDWATYKDVQYVVAEVSSLAGQLA